jgi:hypothetical protein
MKKMTKEQAIQKLSMLSHGTLATLTREERKERQLEATYANIDLLFNEKVSKIENNEVDVSNCKNWKDIWQLVSYYGKV